jgi:hypothetical protein
MVLEGHQLGGARHSGRSNRPDLDDLPTGRVHPSEAVHSNLARDPPVLEADRPGSIDVDWDTVDLDHEPLALEAIPKLIPTHRSNRKRSK